MTGKLIGWAVLIVAFAGAGIYMSRGVWQRVKEQRVEAARSAGEMKQAEGHKAELLRQRADLQSEAGREREAREHGWIRPGDKPL